MVHGPHRVGRGEVPGREGVVFDHGQHDGRGPHLEQGGHLGQVGVAHDHVQPPEALGVGVGLVAGVDDGPLEGGLEAGDLLEELGPLGDLEVDGGLVHGRGLHPDLAGPGVDLAGHEVRHDARHHLGERHVAVHEVVLVAPVGVALAVRVVLVDDDPGGVGQHGRGGQHGAAQDLLARLVVDHALERVEALGRRVLGVGWST